MSVRSRRLTLEWLEDRTLPSSATVVPLAQGINNQTTFHRLVNALAVATNPGDVVTIQPGVTSDVEPVQVNSNGITIQSDPSAAGSVQPVYNLVLNASHVTLSRLNLGDVTINPDFSADAILRSILNTVTVLGGVTGAGGHVIDKDTITGSVVLTGLTASPQNGNRITNNTITSYTPSWSNALIAVSDNNGVVIQNNVITGQAATTQVGIAVTRGVNHFIGNNTITFNGTDLTFEGIVMQNPGGGPAMTATVANNSLATGRGVGLFLNAFDDTNFQALVQGNDFHRNAIGVDYLGDGGSNIASDLGGGSSSLGSSLGANDFRGFPATADANDAAIRLTGVAAGATLVAEENIFANPAGASGTVFLNGPGRIDVSQALSNNLAFVQTLYNDLLGRSGTVAELNSWQKLLTASPAGRAKVVNGILRSDASLDRIVDEYYLKFLGRSADSGGLAYWVNQIKNGKSVEAVEAGFIASPEFQSTNGSDYVQSLYHTFLGRDATAAEGSYWSNQVQQSNGLATTAQGFALSRENRTVFVQNVFVNMVHRPATSGEVNYFVNQPGDLLAVDQMILSTPESFSNG